MFASFLDAHICRAESPPRGECQKNVTSETSLASLGSHRSAINGGQLPQAEVSHGGILFLTLAWKCQSDRSGFCFFSRLQEVL